MYWRDAVRGRGQEGQESEALQLILPPWRPGWEEQHQAASVLLWDVLAVQTNRPRASGLMGTRPAQGPNPLFLLPSSSSPALYVWPKLRRHTLQLKDALQLSQTDLKIFPRPSTEFSHTATGHDVPRLCISADLLDPGAARLQRPALISTDTLSLTFTCFLLSLLLSFHSLSIHLYITHVHPKLSIDSCQYRWPMYWSKSFFHCDPVSYDSKVRFSRQRQHKYKSPPTTLMPEKTLAVFVFCKPWILYVATLNSFS